MKLFTEIIILFGVILFIVGISINQYSVNKEIYKNLLIYQQISFQIRIYQNDTKILNGLTKELIETIDKDLQTIEKEKLY